jgi:hypothetical protein
MRPWIPALLAAIALPLAADAMGLTQTIVPGKLPAAMTRLGGPTWQLEAELLPLNQDRYVLIGTPGYDWEQGAKSPTATGFPILDLKTKQVSVVTVPVDATYKPGSDLIAYDPARQSGAVIVKRWAGDVQTVRFVHWDLAANQFDWSEQIAETTERQQFQGIGLDPAGTGFYFLVAGHPSQKIGYEVHATSAALKRFDLASRTVDWEVPLKLPGRTSHMIGAIDVAVSPDYRTILVKEYSEPGYGKLPPPQAWAVDVASKAVKTLTIPMTPYGVAFDRQGRYLVIGSNAEAKLCRYDLTTGKRDLVIPSLARLHRLALSADNRTLLVFAKGRELEQRAWPGLGLIRKQAAGSLIKGQQWFEPEGMAVMPDGKTLVMHQTQPPYGFKSDKALYQVAL